LDTILKFLLKHPAPIGVGYKTIIMTYNNFKAESEYNFLVKNGARYCDAQEIKELIIDGLSPKEAIYKFIVDACEEEWADAQADKYLQGSLELCQFISEFLKEGGEKDLKKHMEKLGCKGWAFTALTYNQGAEL
tara:strand:+ start:612 stop:1013 length:402 start_codon:yes stop_codon:yes gene_type:complete